MDETSCLRISKVSFAIPHKISCSSKEVHPTKVKLEELSLFDLTIAKVLKWPPNDDSISNVPPSTMLWLAQVKSVSPCCPNNIVNNGLSCTHFGLILIILSACMGQNLCVNKFVEWFSSNALSIVLLFVAILSHSICGHFLVTVSKGHLRTSP